MNQTIYNYLPKCNEDMKEVIANMRGIGGHDDSIEFFTKLLNSANGAMKFSMPMNGRIMQDGLKGLPDGFRLPYPITVIEYPVDNFKEGNFIENATLESPRRIAIAREFPVSEIANRGPNAFFDKPEGSTHVIAVCAFCEINHPIHGHRWMPVWAMGSVFNTRREISGYFGGKSYPLPCEYGRVVSGGMKANGKTQEDILAAARQDISHEVYAILELCEALSCRNVLAEKVEAPAKLNAKRIKNGKAPLPDYHILTVDTRSRNKNGDVTNPTGKHVRQHLRRGHIRVYQSGLRIWVQACVVGDAAHGTVGKSYKVLEPV
jgi:hypothetical protein